MKRSVAAGLLLLILTLSVLSGGAPPLRGAPAPDAGLERFFAKKRVTIAVTDSGLGGLSVLAEAVSRMKKAGTFEAADFVYYNALFSSQGGYNTLKTRGEKIAIFQSALGSLEKRYRPDLILIACNTLSVLYEDALFRRRTKAPVVDIVGPGVDLIAEGLRGAPDSSVIIFGTPTTISEGTHRRELEKAGFAPGRIFDQSCLELESYIEADPAGDETALLISAFVEEALEKLPAPRPPVFASLNCTHYGYSLPLWEAAFAGAGVKPAGLLNPNSRMIDFLFAPGRAGRFPETGVSVRVVSMVEISPARIGSIGKRLAPTSPETAAALQSYEHVPGLFRWQAAN